jgi:hypothetical protein
MRHRPNCGCEPGRGKCGGPAAGLSSRAPATTAGTTARRRTGGCRSRRASPLLRTMRRRRASPGPSGGRRPPVPAGRGGRGSTNRDQSTKHTSSRLPGSCRHSMIGVGAVRTVQQGLPTATSNTAFRSVSCSRPADGDHRMSARPRIIWRGVRQERPPRVPQERTKAPGGTCDKRPTQDVARANAAHEIPKLSPVAPRDCNGRGGLVVVRPTGT